MELNTATAIAELFNAYTELKEIADNLYHDSTVTVKMERPSYRSDNATETVTVHVSKSTINYLRDVLFSGAAVLFAEIDNWDIAKTAK